MKLLQISFRFVFILSIVLFQCNEIAAQAMIKSGSGSGRPDFRFNPLNSIKLYQDENRTALYGQAQSDNPDGPLRKDLLKPMRSTADMVDTVGIHTITHPTLVKSEGGGYVSGNNAFGDLAKAIFRSPASGHSFITGVVLWFGYATGDPSATVDVIIWNDSGGPFMILAAETITLGDIMTDIFYDNMTYVEFSTPIPNPGVYYAGIMLPTGGEADTVALYSSRIDDFAKGNAWEMWNDFSWTPVNVSWDLELIFGIFPVELTPTSVFDLKSPESLFSYELYPNPTQGRFTAKINERVSGYLRIQVYDITGKQVFDDLIENYQLPQRIEINPGLLSKGVYIVRLSSENKTGVQRLIVQ